jgi:hypothetical protein
MNVTCATITTTTTTTTTAAPVSLALGYDVSNGFTACAATTATYYAKNGATFAQDVILYTNNTLTTLVSNGFYSNGSYFGQVSGGSGKLVSYISCTPTTTTTSTTTAAPTTTTAAPLPTNAPLCGFNGGTAIYGLPATTTTTSTTTTTTTTTTAAPTTTTTTAAPTTTTTTAAPTTTTTTAAPTTTTTTAAPTTTTTTTTAAPNTFNVTANGSSNYIINGSSNPTLSVTEGQTYTFNINAVGHPFWIKTNISTGTGNQYNDGITNNGTDNGTITWIVSYDAPSTLYYNCQFHSSMAGTINVIDVPTTTTTTAAPTTTTTTAAPTCFEAIVTSTDPTYGASINATLCDGSSWYADYMCSKYISIWW